ncbi:MAG: integral membrane signal transducer protein [Bacteroidia bacterium]|nr:MAG: integral membrane signal transducer protein [Bacteroidia bacterium]
MDFLSTPLRRKILFASLYASEGAPIGFLWWAFPTILRSEGVPLEDITALTSLLVLPWALKFLWAPAVDLLRFRWPLKRWILTSQFLMGITLLPLMATNPAEHMPLLVAFLLVHAIAAATQDVSIDALCIRVASRAERGSLNGWMQAGMLVSRSLLGGGSLLLVEQVGFRFIIILLVTVVWSSSLLLMLSKPSQESAPPASGSLQQFVGILRSAFSKRLTWLVLFFAVFSGAAFEAVGAVGGPFLVDRGFSTEQVGWFFLVPAVACMSAGALLGGTIADGRPRSSAVRCFLMFMSLCVLGLAAADLLGARGTILLIAVAVIYCAIGLFIASTYALYMDHTTPHLGATQFSAYMGATNACESWSGFVMGRLAGSVGYGVGFALLAGVSLLSLALLPFISDPRSDSLTQPARNG